MPTCLVPMQRITILVYHITAELTNVRVHDKILKGNAVKELMQELPIELTDQLLALR